MKRIFLVTCCLFLSACLAHADAPAARVCHLDNCVSVEVVSKPEDLERGLMFRTGLGQDKGMLFVFDDDDIHRFWMKNMQFDLDMVWMDSKATILYIARNVPACRQDPCPVYSPQQPSRYVLELSSGYAASHHWNAGDTLRLEGILEK